MRKIIAVFGLLLVFMLLSACSGESRDESSSESKSVESNQEAAYDSAVSEEQSSGESAAGDMEETDSVEPVNPVDRMITYEADLSIELKELDQNLSTIENKVKAMGGYLVESSVYSIDEERKGAHLTARVPQDRFQDFLTFVGEASERVIDKNVRGKDVTEEYVDLESRLKAKKAVEERLLSFMKGADKTEDLLKISEDLARVQEEIEQIQGKMNYLKNRTDFAVVTVNIQEEQDPKITESKDLNTWEKAKKTFIETVNGLLAFGSALLVFFIGFSPVLIILGVIAVIALFFYRKRKKQGE